MFRMFRMYIINTKCIHTYIYRTLFSQSARQPM